MTESVTLYALAASHPCAAVEAALQVKGLSYRRIDLKFGLAPLQQLARFGRRTVPAIEIGTERASGSRLIMRVLEGLAPEPPLVPADPSQRRKVDAADEWGDVTFQEHVRWISILGVLAHPAVAPSYAAPSMLPLPEWTVDYVVPAMSNLQMRLLGHSPKRVRSEYLTALPGHLDHIDALIAEGVIGGEQPNVADFQLAGSLRLLLTMEDLRPAIDARPCGRLARRLIPRYPGSLPAGSIASL